MSIFTGSAVAIVTPFKKDGSVDYDKFRDVIEYQIAGGTDCIVVCGTTGESSTLSHEEHLDCIRFCAEVVNKRIPVVAGTGSNCTETAIYLSQEAEKYGVDGLLVVTPYYNKATQKGLIGHYTSVAESIKVPVIMYNVPSRTGCNLQPATVAHLVKNVDNIVAIKDATGDLSQAAQMMNLCDGNLELYSGNDDQVVPLLSIGGLGVISVLSNIAPRQAHNIVMEFLEGDYKKAAKLQLDAIPLINALFSEVNPIPVKAAMNMLGMQAGPLRAPLSELEDAHKEILRQEMIKYGLMK